MLIRFSKLNIKVLILAIFPVFDPIRKILNELKEGKFHDNNFFKLFRYYLSFVLSFIFIAIIKCRTKEEKINIFNKKKNINPKKKEDEKVNKNSDRHSWINPQEKVKNEIKKVKMIKQIIFVGLLILILLTLNIFNITFRYEYTEEGWDFILIIGKQSFGVFFEIIYFILLGKCVLNMKIYKHHLVSLIVMLVDLLLLIASFIKCFPDCTIQTIVYYFFYSFLFCLYCIVGKLHLNSFSNSPYKIMLSIGVTSTIIIVIYEIIMILILDNNDDNNNKYGIIFGFQNMTNLFSILFVIFDITLNFCCNIGIWLILYYFSPFHYIISESLAEYFFIIYDFIIIGRDYKTIDIILYTLIYIINVTFCLIFNEILILKIGGMDFNVKESIEQREMIDNILALETNNDFYTVNTISDDDRTIN